MASERVRTWAVAEWVGEAPQQVFHWIYRRRKFIVSVCFPGVAIRLIQINRANSPYISTALRRTVVVELHRPLKSLPGGCGWKSPQSPELPSVKWVEETVLCTSTRASLWRLSVRLYFGHRPRITPTLAIRWVGEEIYHSVRWCEVSFGVARSKNIYFGLALINRVPSSIRTGGPLINSITPSLRLPEGGG